MKRCRWCGRGYITRTSEVPGYCRQACVRAAARSLGWTRRPSSRSVYEVLRAVDGVGNVDVDPIILLREALERIAHPNPPQGAVYHSGAHLILAHGEAHHVPGPCAISGAPNCCFGNAIIVAHVRGLPYVEGYALSPRGEVHHHAWNLGPRGVIDVTWGNAGEAYLGIAFSVGRADDASWHGDASILDDHKRGHPLLQKEWVGEDHTLTWEPSPVLLALGPGVHPYRCHREGKLV